MWPWLRLCRFVLTWRITRSCTCGPSSSNASVTPVTITAYATVTRTRANRDSAAHNIPANYAPGGSSSSSSIPGNGLRDFNRYMTRSAGTPSCLAAKTCLRSRLASTPSNSKSSSAIPSNVACRHHQLTPGRPVHHPRGDIHIDAQPVRTDPLRPAGVDPDPHPRRVTVHVKGFHRFPSLDRGGNRRRPAGRTPP